MELKVRHYWQGKAEKAGCLFTQKGQMYSRRTAKRKSIKDVSFSVSVSASLGLLALLSSHGVTIAPTEQISSGKLGNLGTDLRQTCDRGSLVEEIASSPLVYVAELLPLVPYWPGQPRFIVLISIMPYTISVVFIPIGLDSNHSARFIKLCQKTYHTIRFTWQ